MTRAELIKVLESLETPTREIADQVLLACGWSTNYSAEEMAEAVRTGNFTYADYDNNEYQVPFTEAMGDCCWYPPGVKRGGKWINGHLRPNPLASIDSALTLGRNEVERRAILGAIYDNANETYTIARCILFGCAHALRLREESPQ